jgi:4-amino-4-deoxy-L-arabinose transferase-like glycosyltransferase
VGGCAHLSDGLVDVWEATVVRGDDALGPSPVTAANGETSRSPARSRRALFILIAILLSVVGVARVAATFTVFSNTIDEPFHLVAGIEWIERGTFSFQGEHPPLGRILAAAGPYLDGVRIHDQQHFGIAARQVFYENNAYLRNLVLARSGMLVFLMLAIAGLAVWAARLYGVGASLVAIVLFTTTPPILAHAGLVTTDIPLVGTLIWTIFALTVFIDAPSLRRAIGLGLTIGLAFVAKISAVVFVPAIGVMLVIAQWLVLRGRPRDDDQLRRGTVTALLGVAAVSAGLVVWSVYRFSAERHLGSFIPGGIILPAPAFFEAIAEVAVHNVAGQPAYLMGQFSTKGWWYFFPLVLGLKTPIPLLILTAIGTVAAARAARATGNWSIIAPIASAAAIMLVAMRASINLGVRHVLPIYPLFAMIAAYGALWLWRQRRHTVPLRAIVVALIAWQSVSSIRAHPDYLTYFNEFAGANPERLVLDSDLDWGQDLLRLADTVRVRRIREIHVAYFGWADLPRHIPDVKPLEPGDKPTGWIAASQTFLLNPNPAYAGYKWLNSLTPVADVGHTIKLFYVPVPGESRIDAALPAR